MRSLQRRRRAEEITTRRRDQSSAPGRGPGGQRSIESSPLLLETIRECLGSIGFAQRHERLDGIGDERERPRFAKAHLIGDRRQGSQPSVRSDRILPRDLHEPQHGATPDLVPDIRCSLAHGEPLGRESRSFLEVPRSTGNSRPNREDLSQDVDARLGRDVVCFFEMPRRSVETSGSMFDVGEVREDLVAARLVTLISVAVQLRLERQTRGIEFARPRQQPTETRRRRGEVGEHERSSERYGSFQQFRGRLAEEILHQGEDRECMAERVRVVGQRLGDRHGGLSPLARNRELPHVKAHPREVREDLRPQGALLRFRERLLQQARNALEILPGER